MDKNDKHRAPPPDRAEVAFRLAVLFETLEISQKDAAEVAGVGKSAVSQWLGKGQPRQIDLVPAIRLCVEYGTTLDYIYRGRYEGMEHGLTQKLRITAAKMTTNRPAKPSNPNPNTTKSAA